MTTTETPRPLLTWGCVNVDHEWLLDLLVAEPPLGAMDQLGAVAPQELVAQIGTDPRVLGFLTLADRAVSSPVATVVYDLDLLRSEIWIGACGSGHGGTTAQAVVEELFGRWPVATIRELSPVGSGLLSGHPRSVAECLMPAYLPQLVGPRLDAVITSVRRTDAQEAP